MEKTMEKIVALAKSRGFVYPGSEIYGGLANTWDYGNLGVELKNNVKRAWWQKFIMENPYNVGVDCAILMNPQTWVASGHLGGFSDPLMDCKECKERFRADQLIESFAEENGIELTESVDSWSKEQMEAWITGKRYELLEGISRIDYEFITKDDYCKLYKKIFGDNQENAEEILKWINDIGKVWKQGRYIFLDIEWVVGILGVLCSCKVNENGEIFLEEFYDRIEEKSAYNKKKDQVELVLRFLAKRKIIEISDEIIFVPFLLKKKKNCYNRKTRY